MITFSRLGQVGRLGNQLFQIAFITQFAKRHRAEYILPYWKYAEYFDFPFVFDDRVCEMDFDEIIREPSLAYNEDYFMSYLPQIYRGNVNIITGYFQSYKYFKKQDIINVFKPGDKYRCPVKIPENSVAISVRRGDFVKHKDYNDVDAEVFRNLLQQFKNHTVFVFTDDYKYCKSEFVGSQFEFMEGLNDIEQLLTLSKFTKFILSNSTFSYWGPMLNTHPEKVLYPYYMFPDMERCKLYNENYWPQERDVYQPYLNPVNKPAPSDY